MRPMGDAISMLPMSVPCDHNNIVGDKAQKHLNDFKTNEYIVCLFLFLLSVKITEGPYFIAHIAPLPFLPNLKGDN